MHKILITLLTAIFTTTLHAEDSKQTYKRGEVISMIARPLDPFKKKERGKTSFMVWDGKKQVKVTVPSNYARKVVVGKMFPFTITRDPKTGQYVATGRRGL